MLNTDNKDKSAFIAIVGRPNVGKSSILNRLMGQKIAIVSSKPQTTRNRITGVLTQGEYQLVFFDTPGMHKPKTSLGKYMVRSVNESVGGVDCCMLVVEAGKEPGDTELNLIEKFKSMEMPAILAINKIDTLKEKEELMKQIARYSLLYDFDAVVPVSAQDGNGMNELLDELKSRQARAVISLMTILLQTSLKELLLPKLSVKKYSVFATGKFRTARLL